MPSLDRQEIYQQYLFPRTSSQYRILSNTIAIGFCGFFLWDWQGFIKAQIKVHLFKQILFLWIIKWIYTFQQETLDLINILYLIQQLELLIVSLFIVVCNQKIEYGQLIKAQKFAGGICLISMFLDLLSQIQRRLMLEYLKKGEEGKKY